MSKQQNRALVSVLTIKQHMRPYATDPSPTTQTNFYTRLRTASLNLNLNLLHQTVMNSTVVQHRVAVPACVFAFLVDHEQINAFRRTKGTHAGDAKKINAMTRKSVRV